ncbi:TPR Domain containing protein [Tritrichomonas foetus]|uniref:TPR Domain containing protein n=1 Tax=Tritrichomonas foetus TaxID=1144522 RepID=A0A1J4KXP1_9EUKA|nr:TPR Domain containing protein [Tritrichomonas foetus]|eukprot:OHT14468.1 TPR Domain containing protein [Tritrichomonas foetus]
MKIYFERIFYYWRQSMYGHIHVLCNGFLKENGVDPLFLIWDALASGAEGKTSAGIATLQKITNRVAMGLPIAVAQLCIHKMAKMQDFASIGQLESDIENLQKSANASTVVQAAQILWLTGDISQALNFVHPLTTQAPANKSAAALVGWIKLSSGDRNSGRWFDMASADPTTTNKPADPLVVYGKAMYFAAASRWQDSIQYFVQLSGLCEFPEVAIERARVYIAMNNWDLAIESLSEAKGRCVSDCEYHLISAIHCLSQIGDLDTAKLEATSLCQCLDRFENENAKFSLNVVRALTGLSWRDPDIVQRCLASFSGVAKAHQEDPEVTVEYGNLLLYANKPAEAKEAFQNALVASSESMGALGGLVSAHLAMNQLSEAHDQLEFLEAMSGSNGSSLQLCSLHSKYSRLIQQPVDIDSLIGALKHHVEQMQMLMTPQSARPSNDDSPQTHPIDKYIENVIALNLNTFSDALTEAMNECNTLERTVASPQNGPVCDIIARILENVPGAVPFSYYLAVLAFGEGRYAQATKAIQSVLLSHWGFNASQCHLLLAQVRLQMKQFDEAEQSLNHAVSFDFNIRHSLRYNMIAAQLSEARGQYDNAITTLKDVMKGKEYQTSTNNEKVDVYLFLARCYKKLGKTTEAMSTTNEAIGMWHGTPDEDRIKLFQASLYASTGKIREGLDALESFEAKSPMFAKAKKTAAKIYLTKLNDKTAYIKCFKQLVASVQNKNSYVLLGDALLKVKRFDEAVVCFHQALSSDPSDQNVALHLARALLIVHDYENALSAYNHAIQVGHNDPHIQVEYCKTLIKLRRLEDAREAALEAMQTIDSESGDWESQAASAEFSELISLIDTKTGDVEQSIEELQDALQIYDRLTAPGRVDIPTDTLSELKQKAAKLYQRCAELATERDDSKGAVESLEKALALDPSSTKILLALGKIRLEHNENDKCQDICQQLLRIDPNCEDAALMLAEVSQSEGLEDLEEAFLRSPTFYRTLVRLIEKCARAGELERVPLLFEKCPNQDDNGLNFCKGLYSVYTGNPQKALKLLNNCRNDPDWGVQAMNLIFIIYSNPNRKYVWCETKPLATSKDLDAAKKVLSRFDPTVVDVQQLRALLLLSMNTPESINEALEIYKEGDDNDLNAVIGRCKCFLRLDKQRDATKYLNGIIHEEPTHSNFSVFVEAFLMMTYISIKESQIDEAEKYVDRAIELNRSCTKAWEMRAALHEKKKDYPSAADAYKQAWDLSSHTQLGIGFKLALNYMRAECPVEAIKVSRIIMEQHPNYPKLKETIFLPCCGMLRP